MLKKFEKLKLKSSYDDVFEQQFICDNISKDYQELQGFSKTLIEEEEGFKLIKQKELDLADFHQQFSHYQLLWSYANEWKTVRLTPIH